MKDNKQTKEIFPCGFTLPHLLSSMAENSAILVAFSGGADSHALLHLLCRYSAKTGAKIYAAHVNHGIRGEEADRDEEFCRRTAKNYGVEFFSERVNIPKIAEECGKSIELAARDERYAFFAKLMKQHNIPLLAVAHNANDNLETVLYNLTRGSGLAGLCGIPRTRQCEGGMLIRPVLSMSREDILEYCRQYDIQYVTDSTNTDTDYARNRIRSNVIPELKALNSAVERNMLAQSEILRADSELLTSLACEFIKENIKDDNSLPLSALNTAAFSVASRAIMQLYENISGCSLERRHIDAVISLCQGGVAHSRISLPNGVYASIENNALYVATAYIRADAVEAYSIEAKEGSNFISQTNSEIIIQSTQKPINIYKKSIQFSINSAKIKGTLVLRSRCEGDKIFMGGMHKSVKKLMCDKKIPTDIRKRLPVICDECGIVAIPFVGVRDDCRIKNREEFSENIKTIHFYLY